MIKTILLLWLFLGIFAFGIYVIEIYRWLRIYYGLRTSFFEYLGVLWSKLSGQELRTLFTLLLLGPIGIYFAIVAMERIKKESDDQENQ